MMEPATTEQTRAGHVALVGAPNAGKSTLLNALIGERLSIVTSKAQTTRQNVTGIRTDQGAQGIFLDTPGLLDPSNLLQRSMRAAATQALEDADVVVVVVDAQRSAAAPEHRAQILQVLHECSVPNIIAINKIDVSEASAIDDWRSWSEGVGGGTPVCISASDGVGVAELWAKIVERLPISPFFYDPDDLSTANLRFFVAELVRETALEALRQEIPYGLACAVEEFREDQDPVYIQTTIYVERNSQKGIVVGKGGARIRQLGARSREKIEALLGTRVYLDLWVKVLPGWRTKRTSLQRLGFAVPDDDAKR